MKRANVELIEKVYEALRRKDADAVAAFCASDIQVHQSDELPWGGTYTGSGEAMQFFGKVMSFIDSEVAVERILDAGDYVVMTGRTVGTSKATRRKFDVPLVHLWRVKEQKVASLAVFLDNVSILPALMPEQQPPSVFHRSSSYAHQ